MALLASTTIALAYAVDKPLYPKGVEPAGHSHAFDVYTHPFHMNEPEMAESAKFRMLEFWKANELGATSILGGLILFGLIVNLVGPKKIEAWFHSESPRKSGSYDIYVPDWILGATAVISLIVASVAGTFLYYPDAEELLPDLAVINTECVLSSRTKNWEAAMKWIAYADDLSRRLEVGVFLRHGEVDPFKSAKAKTYREKLDILKHAVEEQNEAEIEDIAMDVAKSYQRLSNAFKEQESFGISD